MIKWLSLLYNIIIIESLIELCVALNQRVLTIPSFDELVSEYLTIGDMNYAYLTYNQYVNFTVNITTRFSSILTLSSIGKSYEGNDIPLIQFSSKKKNCKGILINGMHHGREPVSMMMSIYVLLKLLGDYNQLSSLIGNTNIYFIPMINVDSYKYNCEQFQKTLNIHSSYSRKNRNNNITSNCTSEQIGVDLNRNYDYFFGEDNFGSSDKKCEEDYRGSKAFSEPETIAMRDFLLNHKDIQIVINYHSFGNLLITPFNYATIEESNRQMQNKFPFQLDVYKEFALEGNFPKGVSIGNGMKTIKYKANGDASDWMLGVLGIVSFSPEIGTNDTMTEVFYPNKINTFKILKENLPGAMYSIQKACYYLHVETIQSAFINCNQNNTNSNATSSKCERKNDKIIVHQLKINNTGLGNYSKEEKAQMSMIIETVNVTLSRLTIKIANKEKNDLLYEQKVFESKADEVEIFFKLSIDIESRKEAFLYIEIISDGLVNITYNKVIKEVSLNTEWNYNKPSLNISYDAFSVIDNEPQFSFDSKPITNYFKLIVIGIVMIVIVIIIYFACIIKRNYIDDDLNGAASIEKQIKAEIDLKFPQNKNILSTYIELNNIAIPNNDILPI